MGDMDFKVAGTDQGMTAWQMDLKIKGISYEIMRDAMSQAVEARKRILDVMTRTISSSRTELSPYAPRMTRITIDKEKIGNIIGPGGKTIRSIIEETGTTINVENDGTVLIGSTSLEATQRAVEMIESLTKEVEVGGIYTGKVTRIMNFGAFVEILPGKEGLVHISELADYRVGKVEDEVNIDDEITVMVVEIDQLGRINLSRRATLQSLSQVGAGEEREARPYRPSQPRGDRGNSQEHRREGGTTISTIPTPW
jgi:polyribonucleotide nucleotidyltransferase